MKNAKWLGLLCWVGLGPGINAVLCEERRLLRSPTGGSRD
jgi:hypothetical protein